MAGWSEMRCCGGGVVGARCRLSLLRSSPVAVVEERALEHGPPETNPRFPPGHHQIPMGCLLLCTLHVSIITVIVIYVHCFMSFNHSCGISIAWFYHHNTCSHRIDLDP